MLVVSWCIRNSHVDKNTSANVGSDGLPLATLNLSLWDTFKSEWWPPLWAKAVTDLGDTWVAHSQLRNSDFYEARGQRTWTSVRSAGWKILSHMQFTNSCTNVVCEPTTFMTDVWIHFHSRTHEDTQVIWNCKQDVNINDVLNFVKIKCEQTEFWYRHPTPKIIGQCCCCL